MNIFANVVFVSAYMGVQNDFISGANFIIWRNLSLTAAAGVACAPQIRTLVLRRFKILKTQAVVAHTGVVTTQDDRQPSLSLSGATRTTDKRGKSTPLILSNTFLSGMVKFL